MSSAKVAAASVLAAVSLSACGAAAKPVAGSPQVAAKSTTRVNDPRKKHIECLHQEHVQVERRTIDGDPGFQVETRPSGPTVVFLSTAGAAQFQQIQGKAQGAEVIGAALLYPNQASDRLLNKVEACVTKGVSG